MNLGDLFRSNAASSAAADRATMVSRYKRLRTAGQNLNHKLVARLDKGVLHEGGKKLGILQRGTLVFNSEDEASILMDYCLYDVRRNGRNMVERYLMDSAPDPESDEMACLRAMQRATYSLFVVESALQGVGVRVRDLLSNETIFIVDMGFGSTAKPRLVFASRLLLYEDFAMTCGAALPVGQLPEGQQQSIAKKLAKYTMPNENGRFDPAPIICDCLRRGCSSHVQYCEPTEGPVPRHRASGGTHFVGRNAHCPCGSGRKFKHCCMGRS